MKLLIGSVLFFMSLSVNSAVIYNFEGVCNAGCSGLATGSLILADSYTPGTQASDIDFISFSYSSSSGSFEIPSDLALNRIYNSVLPAANETSISWVEIDAVQSGTGLNACGSAGTPDFYHCPYDGFWAVEWDPEGISRDTGLSYSWTLVETSAVPVPSAVWLFSSGLIGLISLGRRTRFIKNS